MLFQKISPDKSEIFRYKEVITFANTHGGVIHVGINSIRRKLSSVLDIVE